MKIAIDCRYLGMSGIGKYLSGILENLDFEKNDYTLVGRKEKLTEIKQNFSPAYCEDSPFSLKGLFRFPSKRVNECDVFLTPNFLIPYGIKCKIFSTIHDVVFLDIKECNNGYFDYRIKKHLLKRALACSEKVFTVSNFSQERIIHYFPKHSNKIIISGCSVTKDIIEYENPNGQIDKEEILLYVGNIKKHKGLRILLDAYERIKKENRHYRLQIIGNA
ncbi:MAG: glycosyltransferase, partial [Clostridiales bacterium]|nr:glycosyltransferase [Clostridiales bacterium]